MKKLLGIVVLMLSLVLIAGCTKDNKELNNEERKIYAKNYVEEYETGDVEVTYVIILNEDGTGLMCIQDFIPVTYDDTKIYYQDGDIAHEYKVDGDKLIVDFNGITDEFTLSDESVLESLPSDIFDYMK